MMEAHVWIGRGGRWNPFQRFEEGTLSLDGGTVTLRSAGEPVTVQLSEAELDFPRSMTGSGFVMTVRGVTTHISFYNPFAGRSAMQDGARLKTLRATTR